MSNRINTPDQSPVKRKNNGCAEKSITGEDMNKYKNALDRSRSYVSGDEDRSSSSHQFTEKPSEK